MKLKNILLIIYILLLMPIVSATLDYENQDQTITKGEQTEININFKNSYDFKLYNISVENNEYITSDNIDILEPNQTKAMKFTLLSNQILSETFNLSVKFYYELNSSGIPQTHHISIEQTKIDPNDITIRKGDTIVFENNKDGNLDAIIPEFSMTITNGDSESKTFNEINEYSYYESGTGLTGIIRVINESDELMAHSSAMDGIMQFKLNVVAEQTTISISPYEDSITMESDGTYELPISILNLGTETAYNIHLSTNNEWITFNENDFDIDKNSNKLIISKIKPDIIKTEDTNKTYTIILSAKADNSQQVSKEINVFINYKDLDGVISNGTKYTINYINLTGIDETIQWCRQYPDYAGCSDFIVYINKTIEVEKPHQVSDSDMVIFKNKINSIFDTINGEIKLDINEIKTKQNNISGQISSINEKQKVTEKQIKGVRTTLTIVILIIFISGALYIGKYLINKYSNNDMFKTI